MPSIPTTDNPQVLLTLRARGYGKVLAVFGFRQEAQFVEKRLRQAGALGGICVDYLAGREGGEYLDVGKPDLVLFFNPQVRAGLVLGHTSTSTP
jgi:hypothetical protein